MLGTVKTKNKYYAHIRAAQKRKAPEINTIPRYDKMHNAQQEHVP